MSSINPSSKILNPKVVLETLKLYNGARSKAGFRDCFLRLQSAALGLKIQGHGWGGAKKAIQVARRLISYKRIGQISSPK